MSADKSADYRTKFASFGVTIQIFSIPFSQAQRAAAVRTGVAEGGVAVRNSASRRRGLRGLKLPSSRTVMTRSGRNAWRSKRWGVREMLRRTAAAGITHTPVIRSGALCAAVRRCIRLAKESLGVAWGGPRVIARWRARSSAQHVVTSVMALVDTMTAGNVPLIGVVAPALGVSRRRSSGPLRRFWRRTGPSPRGISPADVPRQRALLRAR